MEEINKTWGWLKRNLARAGVIMDRSITTETETKEERGKVSLSYEPACKGTGSVYASYGLLAGVCDGHIIRDSLIGTFFDSPDREAQYRLSVRTDSGWQFDEMPISPETYNSLKNGEVVKVKYTDRFQIVRGRSNPNDVVSVQRKNFLGRDFVGIEKIVG